MRCEHTVRVGGSNHQCKRTAKEGFNLCDQHGWGRKYYIGFTWQEHAGDHWTDKKKAVWPILFKSRLEAERHLQYVGKPFINMAPRRKLTCCVEHTKKFFPQPELKACP